VEFYRLGSVDLEQVLALEKHCFSCPWSEKQFRLALDQKLFNIFGLRECGRLLAYLSLYHTDGEMEILNLAVTPERRRQGLGGRLLGLVVQIGRNMGVDIVLLEVRESNVAARSLYAGFGFRQVGVRRRYYPDNGEDALLLRMDLGEEDVPLTRVAET
jgi:[ribosomal protein S18]-alanine N-acetyltransferase